MKTLVPVTFAMPPTGHLCLLGHVGTGKTQAALEVAADSNFAQVSFISYDDSLAAIQRRVADLPGLHESLSQRIGFRSGSLQPPAGLAGLLELNSVLVVVDGLHRVSRRTLCPGETGSEAYMNPLERLNALLSFYTLCRTMVDPTCHPLRMLVTIAANRCSVETLQRLAEDLQQHAGRHWTVATIPPHWGKNSIRVHKKG